MTDVNNAYKYKNGICEFRIGKKITLVAKDFKITHLYKPYCWPQNLADLTGKTSEPLCFCSSKSGSVAGCLSISFLDVYAMKVTGHIFEPVFHFQDL